MSIIADYMDESPDERGDDRSAGVEADAAPQSDRADAARVTAALDRILRSRELHASPRQQRLLVYIVEETLAGRADRLKAYTIATAVLGRNEHFNPQADPVVRIEIGQLRRCLERYYLTEGRHEALRIEIPKGAYAAHFPEVPAARATIAPPAPAAGTGPAARGRSAGRYMGVAVALFLASLLLGAFAVPRFVNLDDFTRPGPSADLSIDGPIVQVDQMLNASGDPKLDGIAGGLSAELIRRLVRFKTLQVVAADLLAKPVRTPIDYRLSGSVNRLSDRLLVSAQLRDAKTDGIILTENYSIPAGAPDAARVDVARGLAQTVGDPFGPLFSSERQRTGDARQPRLAIRHCLLRFFDYTERERPEMHREVRDCHERAASLAPSSAQVWINLAFLYVDEHRFGFNAEPSAPPALDRAAAAARRAVDLEPTDARAHLALSIVHTFKHEPAAARAEMDKALELNPNDPTVLAEVGLRRFVAGDVEGGTALVTRALAHGSARPLKYHIIPSAYAYLKGDYRVALDEAIQGDLSRFAVGQIFLSAIYGRLGRRDEARAAWEALSRSQAGLTDNPRAAMRARGWQPDLIEALIAGLDQAGLVKE